MIIYKAIYGGKDVKSILDAQIKDGSLKVKVGNELFGDPMFGVFKYLEIETSVGSKKIPEDSFLSLSDVDKGDMEYPFISCKCITYGRVDTLEEAVQSFLLQEYPGKKELIIVNDYPLQKLVYDHPEIKIYNMDETFPTIGDKENYAIEHCSGELIAVWDDDDVALPNHLSNIAKFWRPDANILHWEKGVFYNEPNITKLMGLGNSGIVYSKKAWEVIGKSPIQNAGGDMTLVIALKNLGRQGMVLASPPDEECSWFYMWGGRSYHQSGMGTDTAERPNIIQRHSEHIESLRKKGLIPTGDIQLIPHWNKDYIQMLKDYIKK